MDAAKKNAASKRIKKEKRYQESVFFKNLERFFRKYKHIFALLCMIGIMLGVSFHLFEQVVRDASETPACILSTNNANNTSQDVIGKFDKETIINQNFIATERSITGFSIQFATYGAVPHGVVTATLVNLETNQEVYKTHIDISEIRDNLYYDILFYSKAIPTNPGDRFQLNLYVSNLYADSELTVYHTGDLDYAQGDFFINGRRQQNDLSFKIYSGQNAFIKYLFWILAVAIILFFVVLYVLIFCIKIKIERLAAVILLFFGMIYMFVIPPKSVPDEQAHIDTAYHYSNLMMFQNYPEDNSKRLTQRKEDAEFLGLQPQITIENYRTLYKHFFEMQQSDEMVQANAKVVNAPFFLYIPSALGITIGRLLHLGTVPMYYLGRLFNLLSYIVLMYLAIKKMPFGKMILFGLCVLPLMLQQSASFSYDVLLNSLAFLLIAYILSIAYGTQEIKVLDLIILCVLSGLLSLCKGGAYFPIAFLSLIIPIKRFPERKNHHIFVGAAIGVSCLAFFGYHLSLLLDMSSGSEGFVIEWSQTPAYTIPYMLSHIGETLELFANTFIQKKDFYLISSIGRLGWLEFGISNFLALLFVLFLVLTAIKPQSELQPIKLGVKFWMICIILGSVVLVEVGMATSWTPIDYEFIEGVQGRYFIPVYPLLFLLLRNHSLTFQKNTDRTLLFSGMWLQFAAITEIIRTLLFVG